MEEGEECATGRVPWEGARRLTLKPFPNLFIRGAAGSWNRSSTIPLHQSDA